MIYALNIGHIKSRFDVVWCEISYNDDYVLTYWTSGKQCFI